MVSIVFSLYAIILPAATVQAWSSPPAFTLSTWFTNFPGFGAPAINASGGSFWVGKPASSYCPPTVANVTTCPPGNVTSFVAGSQHGTLFLNTAVPGGQQGTR